MKLHIANVTHQRQSVFWRMEVNSAGVYDERRAKAGLRSVNIMPGRQVALPDMEVKEQIQNVMDQLARVGGIGVEQFPNNVGRHRIAYLLSVDKPVPAAKMKEANDHNRGLAISQGKKNRQAAALAVNHAVEHMVREATQDNVRNMTVEIEQEQRMLADGEEVSAKNRLGEGFDIVKSNEDPKERKKLRAQRNRAES